MSFHNVLDQYAIESSKVSFKHVSNSTLNKLALKINQLRIEIINHYEYDEHLLEVLNIVRKCFFKLVSGVNTYDQLITKELEKEVLMNLTKVKDSYPDLFNSVVLDIAKLIKKLSETTDNSLQEAIINFLNKEKDKTGLKIAIISKSALSTEEKDIVKKKCETSLRIRFFTFSGYRKNLMVYDKVVYIGSPDYFGEAAKRNFNSKCITFFSYDFFPNQIEPKNILSEIGSKGIISTVFEHVQIERPLKPQREIFLAEREYKEEAVIELVEKSLSTTDSYQDNIEAKVVMLENNRVIFIPSDAKVRIFSPNSKIKAVIQKSFAEVEEDNFIVIRNESDSKLIAEVADREVLKDKADSYRKMQQHWKERLRKVVEKKGLKLVSDILQRKHHMKTASPALVRSWCSQESICPTELELLLSALKYKAERITKICTTMNAIKSAHISAGRIISDKLMSELSVDIDSELQEKGFYTFASIEFNGASFNVERIVSINHTIRTVASSNVMKVMNLN
ncbi:hypothetical protein [Alkalihalobacillus sp. R86527]|uniref:hypothetical protein n=1 Tax=Alkalihalobacillus sp. R86527 TaxID=3093863 RepID=UPI003671CB04